MHPTFLGHLTDPANPYAPFNWYNAFGAAGCALWIVAYILFIRQGWKDRTYGVPMAAICLNITWEAVTFTGPAPVPLWKWIEGAWLFIDVIILWQLWIHGKSTMLRPSLQRYHHLVIVGMLALATGFHLTWRTFWDDELLFVNAFIINLIMSVLFISLALARPTLSGLTIPGAWCKFLGTILTGVQCLVFLPKVMHERESWAFLWYLVVAIAICDALYLFVLYHLRRITARVGTTPTTT